MRTPTRHRGFTLMECLLATVILALTVLAIAQAVGTGIKQTNAALYEEHAVALLEAMMEEVLSRPYNDPQGTQTPGPESGETSRALYDNLDDYHGLVEQPGQVADASGTLYPAAYQGFRRSVTCTYGSVNAGLGALPGLTITVTVTDTRGRSWTLTRFVAQPQ
jgi:MSHA pilin protein MshD